MSRMMSRLSAFTLSIALTLAFALPARAQIVIDPPADEPTWALTPGTAAAGSTFELTVLSYRYNCGHTYSNQSVVVNEGQIDLSFIATANPKVMCPAIYRPYGPTFKMPALKAGKYRVFMNLMQPCHLDGCKMAIPREEAGTLVVTAEGEITYIVDPSTVAAGTAFVLNLLSPQFGCNIEYSRQSSSVQDGKITLTYLDKANPLIRCIPEKKAYGPAYRLAGLKAGTYEVWAVRLPACVERGCEPAPAPVLAGRLVVKGEDPVRKGWFLRQKEVKAGMAFPLQIVNNEYGNCNWSFGHTSLVVQDGKIHTTFAVEHHPERVCITDIRPHGPSFQMQALKPGVYPVTVQVMPACVYEKPSCLPVILLAPPQVVDTLIVTQTLSLGGTSAPPGTGPLAAWREGSLGLLLPARARGLWRADVLSLSGRVLHSQAVTPGAETRLGFKKTEPGMVLLRVQGPAAKETHTLRVPITR